MDRTRFLELATAEWKAVYRFALRLTRDPHRAEDLVQDVFTQALRPERIAAFEPRGGGVRSWLLRITYRAHLSKADRSRLEGTLFTPVDESDPAAGVAIEATRVQDFDWDGVDERLRAAVGELDAGSREVLMLWAVEHLQYQEIAGVLDIPIGTVMSRLHRARTKVSQSLLSDAEAADDLGLRRLGPSPTAAAAPRRETQP
ncbi:MAG: sigma-70 family RNA polymerase sigma factor [Planctomycetes bacterium]|nr:sigma-70 family RNA polymerase sigma factor [Planctomycetota bacterium]